MMENKFFLNNEITIEKMVMVCEEIPINPPQTLAPGWHQAIVSQKLDGGKVATMKRVEVDSTTPSRLADRRIV